MQCLSFRTKFWNHDLHGSGNEQTSLSSNRGLSKIWQTCCLPSSSLNVPNSLVFFLDHLFSHHSNQVRHVCKSANMLELNLRFYAVCSWQSSAQETPIFLFKTSVLFWNRNAMGRLPWNSCHELLPYQAAMPSHHIFKCCEHWEPSSPSNHVLKNAWDNAPRN